MSHEKPDLPAILKLKEELDTQIKQLLDYLEIVNKLGYEATLTDLLSAQECAMTYDKVVDLGEGDPIAFTWSTHPRVGENYELDTTVYSIEELQIHQFERCQYSGTTCDGCRVSNEQTAVFDLNGFSYPQKRWCQDCYLKAMLKSNP